MICICIKIDGRVRWSILHFQLRMIYISSIITICRRMKLSKITLNSSYLHLYFYLQLSRSSIPLLLPSTKLESYICDSLIQYCSTHRFLLWRFERHLEPILLYISKYILFWSKWKPPYHNLNFNSLLSNCQDWTFLTSTL